MLKFKQLLINASHAAVGGGARSPYTWESARALLDSGTLFR